MKRKLTALAIPTLPEGSYHDAGSPGLQLRVGRERKTWSVFHRTAGKLRQSRLGHFPQMSLADARRAAAALADAVEAGLAAPSPVPHPRDKVLTMAGLVDRYEQYKRRRGSRIRTLDECLRGIRKGLAPYLATPAKAFDKAAMRDCRDRIAKTAPAASNNFVTNCTTMLKWADSEDLVGAVPTVLKIGHQAPRERVLGMDELAAIWRASEQMTKGSAAAFGRLIRLLMLSGLRRSEGAKLRHGDVLNGVVRLKPEATKSNRAHALPLPPLALVQLGEGGARDLCFPRRDGGVLGGWDKLKKRLDELAGVEGWTVHDLRRSFASHLQALDVPPDVIRACLNHALGGAASIYLRSTLEPQKKAALERWASQVETIVDGNKRAAS